MNHGARTSAKPERRRELDAMGMLIVVGLVFFHTAQIFGGSDMYVQNEPPSMVALAFVAFASLWGMPLMFLMAGTAIWYSLRKRTVGEFVRERFRRLFVPFVVGLPLLAPPQVYIMLTEKKTRNKRRNGTKSGTATRSAPSCGPPSSFGSAWCCS